MRRRYLILLVVITMMFTGCSLLKVDKQERVDDRLGLVVEAVEDNAGDPKSLSDLLGGDSPAVNDEDIKHKVEMPDGSEIYTSSEAVEAIQMYEEISKSLISKEYPQDNEIDIGFDLQYETTVESSYKISKIQYVVTNYDEKGDGVLIANVRGSIAGLNGEYEIIIPVDKAVNINVGDSFAITYQTVRLNGTIVVTNIKY